MCNRFNSSLWLIFVYCRNCEKYRNEDKGDKTGEGNFKWFGYWESRKRNEEKNHSSNIELSQRMHPSRILQAVPATSLPT